MLFSSITFLYFFLPITLGVYLLIPPKGKNGVLLLASFLFYFWGEPKYSIFIVLAVFIGYLGGRFAGKSKIILGLCISMILGLLFLFKYTDFIIGGINTLFGRELPLLKLALPIGISFYSFQIIGYLVDVHRYDVPIEYNFIDFAAYVMMFPQLIAGPIVRYESIYKEMKSRDMGLHTVGEGCSKFAVGLGKKILIADTLGELMDALNGLGEGGFVIGWTLAITFMLQLYYDFSGYSDMAIGLGKMLGFTFPKNFDYPYISKSITEFWRRWHMTLGGWFRDYLYIPLGGSKVSKSRWCFNLFVVWFCSGLWHGAGINFILWGLYFGVFLFLEKAYIGKFLEKMPNILRHLYTLMAVAISFVLFRLESLGEIMYWLKQMFNPVNGGAISSIGMYEIKSYSLLLLTAIIFATPLFPYLKNVIKQNRKISFLYSIGKPVGTVVLLLLSTSFLIGSTSHPFLYFRF